MGNIVASKAFLPPYPSYDESMSTLVWATSKLGDRVPCTYWPNSSARFTVLFSHGNAEDIGQLNEWFGYLSRALAISILSYDYRGYGLHPGVPTESSCYADIEGVYDFMTNELKIPPSRIILYGRSIGSGPTCYLGQQLSALSRSRNRTWWNSSFLCRGPSPDDDTDPLNEASSALPAGFILQSPIASAIRVVSTTLAMLPVDIFVNVNRIGKIDIPTLIVHGTADEVVPYWHGTELIDKAANPYKLVSLDGAGHNNVEADYMDELLTSLNEFFMHLEKTRREDDQRSSSASGSRAADDEPDGEEEEEDEDS